MFRVKLTYPFNDDFQRWDAIAILAAGRKPDHTGATTSVDDIRDMIWETRTFDDAITIRRALNRAGFTATKIDEL